MLNLFTVNVTTVPTLLYGSQGTNSGPVQVINTSQSAVTWIGTVSNLSPGVQSIPLKPGASVTFDGSKSVYAVSDGNGTATIAVVPGGLSYSPGSAITQLFTLSAPVSTVGPVQQIIVAQLDVSQYSSFDLNISAQCLTQGNVGAPLTCKLTMLWSDDPTGSIGSFVAEEEWNFWVGDTVSPQPAYGSGPMRGRYLSIGVVTPPGQVCTLQTFTLTGTLRSLLYTSFRQFPPSIACNGAIIQSLAGNNNLDGYSNNMGCLPNITPGTGLRLCPLPLYAGPVSIEWQVSTAVLLNQATIVDMSQVTSGNLAAGTGQTGVIWRGSNVINTLDARIVNFPRSACGVVLNPAATSNTSFNAVAQQGY